MTYCTKTVNSMTGNFCEILEDAGSCRGEQLGLFGIHHFTAALYMSYSIKNWHTRVNCDNEGVINMSDRNLSEFARVLAVQAS